MSGHGSWARIAPALDAAVEAERDELAAELELVQGELQDERTARLLADSRICELEDAIRAHRKAIRERVPVKSGRDIDGALWKQVDQ